MMDLDQLLQEAAKPVQVSDALMARILADAQRVQPVPRPFGQAKARGFWGSLSDMFGGTGVLAGLATVACAGIYLGAVQPPALSTVTLALSGSSAVDQLDFMPSIDSLLAEE